MPEEKVQEQEHNKGQGWEEHLKATSLQANADGLLESPGKEPNLSCLLTWENVNSEETRALVTTKSDDEPEAQAWNQEAMAQRILLLQQVQTVQIYDLDDYADFHAAFDFDFNRKY